MASSHEAEAQGTHLGTLQAEKCPSANDFSFPAADVATSDELVSEIKKDNQSTLEVRGEAEAAERDCSTSQF